MIQITEKSDFLIKWHDDITIVSDKLTQENGEHGI